MKYLLVLLLLTSSAHGQKIFLNNVREPKPPATITYDTVAIKFMNGAASIGGNWNNFDRTAASSISSLKFLGSGANSGYTAAIDAFTGVTTLTAATASDPMPAGFPLAVTNRVLIRTGSQNMTLTFTGLDDSKTYDFVGFVSRPGVAQSATFTSQSKSATITSINSNTTDVGKITALTPSSGTIAVVISSDYSSRNINACYLIKVN